MKHLYLVSCIVLSWRLVAATTPDFVIPNESTAYSCVFAHGLFGSWMQARKYTSQDVTANGHVLKRNAGVGINILYNVSATNFSEIRLFDHKSSLINPLTWVKYAACRLAHFIQYRQYGIYVEKSPGMQTSSPVVGYWVNPFNLNIAQDEDCAILKQTYDDHLAQQQQLHPGKDITIACGGASRGAAAAFIFLARYKPNNVKIAVLEGCFDGVKNVIKNRPSLFMRSLRKLFDPASLNKFLGYICKYKPDGISPIDLVDQFPKNLPILFSTSEKDDEVPMACTVNLYNELRKAGHQKAHLLILKNSSHPNYMYDDPEDTQKYEQAVHAFYKKYGMPYNQELALAGDKYINNY